MSIRTLDGNLIGALLLAAAAVANAGQSPAPRSSDPSGFVVVGETTLFFASLPTHGQGLWRTDGTTGGTTLVKDLEPGRGDLDISCMVVANGVAYFIAEPHLSNDPSEENEVVLWRSDGTTEGTVPIKRIAGFLNTEELCDVAASGDDVYFVIFHVTPQWRGALWKSDGTEAGTVAVKQLDRARGVFEAQLAAANGLVYFRIPTAATGTEPWRSDGTVEGTFPLREGSSPPLEFLSAGNGVCFSVPSQQGIGEYELWCSDGTPEGTEMILERSSLPGRSFNGNLFVPAVVGGESGLFRTDGTRPGTQLVRNGDVVAFEEFAGSLYLSSEPAPANGMIDLLRSDGTPNGTTRVAEIAGRGILPAGVVDGLLVFRVDTAPGEFSLWRSDGNPGGTSLAYELGQAALKGDDGRRLYFRVLDEAVGAELFVGDATTAPHLLKNIAPDGLLCAGDCTADDRVTIDELITGVAMALGTHPIEACMALDTDGSGGIAINELVAGVGNALTGCTDGTS